MLVNKLVAAGFSLGKLPLSCLVQAMLNDNSVLTLVMLDGGIANPLIMVQTKTEQLSDKTRQDYVD